MNINNIGSKKIVIQATKISKIKIPMIQRDYVQGLDNDTNSYKLDRFLDALYNIINSNNNAKLSLDFIYGNISEDGVFEPIDGQQRLTTLALLNFYIYCKQDNITMQNPFEYITYATRQSAKKFCELLRDENFIQHLKNNIIQMDADYEIKPSNIIKSYHKYFKEYNEDTTIISMLNTIDKIHKKFHNIEVSKYKNINKIDFNILSMNNFNLSDDLYIKMNGRGKQLSNFDNFKADYFKWLKENKIDNAQNIQNKFNNKYIDIFWDFAVENNNGIPDPESLFFRFINRFIIGKILNKIDTNPKSKETNSDLKEDIAEYIKQKNSKKSQQPPTEYTEDDAEIDTQVAQFLHDMQEYFFDDNGARSENNRIIYSRFDFYEFILMKYNQNLINILNNLYNIKKNDHGNKSFKKILSHYCKATWQKNFNIFDVFKYKQLFIYNTIFSFLENSLPIDQIKNNLNYVSRLVWNIAEQYNISVGIDKDTYRTIADRFEFLYNLSFDITNNENTTINIYQNFINTNKDYKGNQLKIIIDDEIKKCNYIIEDETTRDNNMIDNGGQSIEKKLIELESLPDLKGSIGFLLGNQIKDFNDIYDISLEIFGQNKEIDININNSNSYFNRYILLNYFKKYSMEKKKYNETLFTIQALKSKLIIDQEIQSIAYNFVKDIKEKKHNNLCSDIIPNIENFKKEYNKYTKIDDILLYDSILMLLYATKNNSFLLNEYYILDKFLPCIIKKKYHKKDYRANKRRESEFANSTIQEIIVGIEEISKHNNIELVTHKNKISYHINLNDKVSVFSNIVAETSNNRIQISFNINNKPYLVYINHNSIGFQCEYKKIKSIYHMIKYIDDLQNAANNIQEIIIKLAENKEAQFQDIAKEYCNKNKGFTDYNFD